jgi:hypothetical protein
MVAYFLGLIELAAQAQKKEQQQQQSQKKKKKKAAKSNSSTQVKAENGVTSITRRVDTIPNLKKVAPDCDVNCAYSRPVRKGAVMHSNSNSDCKFCKQSGENQNIKTAVSALNMWQNSNTWGQD